MIFKNNVFEENIGLFGGAVSINSPNWSEARADTNPDVLSIPSADKPYLIFKDNQFNKNMAYISGSAVHIRQVKHVNHMLETCGVAYFEDNTFNSNFGFKITDGGGVSTMCTLTSDELNRDYHAASTIPAEHTAADKAISDAITDLISAETYQPYFRSTIFWKDSFELNVGGKKGSAIYSKGISNLILLTT